VALVVKSAVKAQLKGFRVGGDFFAALDKQIAETLKTAMARAKANGRKTLRAADL
jgi:histone H3/H4